MSEFMEVTSLPAVARVKNFLDGIAQENASINIIEKKLLCEKQNRRKLKDKARKLKYRVKLILEQLKATEVEIDNATSNINHLEENLRNCDNSDMIWKGKWKPLCLRVLKKTDGQAASVPTGLDHNLFASTTSPSPVVPVVNRVIEVNPTPFTTPDIPDPLFASGPSNRVEHDSSIDDNLTAVTCEKFPVSEESHFVAVKIKQEPPDPFDILSANVEGKLNRFSEAPPSANRNVGSLFEPPVLIKDEIVSSEEDL